VQCGIPHGREQLRHAFLPCSTTSLQVVQLRIMPITKGQQETKNIILHKYLYRVVHCRQCYQHN
jgi:hypothetical protein